MTDFTVLYYVQGKQFSLPYSRCYLRFQTTQRMNEFITKLDRSAIPNSEGKISVMVSPNQKWEYIVNKTSLNTLESDPDYQQFLEKEAEQYESDDENGDEKKFKPLDLPEEKLELVMDSSHESFMNMIRKKIGKELGPSQSKKKKSNSRARRAAARAKKISEAKKTSEAKKAAAVKLVVPPSEEAKQTVNREGTGNSASEVIAAPPPAQKTPIASPTPAVSAAPAVRIAPIPSVVPAVQVAPVVSVTPAAPAAPAVTTNTSNPRPIPQPKVLQKPIIRLPQIASRNK
ncbi:hypothetical protein WA556_004566 [Blastocystis sp. ATCC 50177/Nand II]